MAGPAIVDTLFGDANPGGKSADHVSAFGRADPDLLQSQEHRPAVQGERKIHIEISRHPEHAALSVRLRTQLHEFRLSNLQLEKDCRSCRPRASRSASMSTNTGKRRGRRGRSALHSRCRRERDAAGQGTARVSNASRCSPARSRRSSSRSLQKDLAFLGRDLKPVLEPGEFQVYRRHEQRRRAAKLRSRSSNRYLRPIVAPPTAECETVDPPPAAPVPTARDHAGGRRVSRGSAETQHFNIFGTIRIRKPV